MSTKEQTWQETVGGELACYWVSGNVIPGTVWPSNYYGTKFDGLTIEDILRAELRLRFRDGLDESAVEREFDLVKRKTWPESWPERRLLSLLAGDKRHRRPSDGWTRWYFENADLKKFWTEESPGDWYFDYDQAMLHIAKPAVRRSLLDAAFANGWLDVEELVEPGYLAMYRARTDPRQTAMALNKRGSRRPKRTSRKVR